MNGEGLVVSKWIRGATLPVFLSLAPAAAQAPTARGAELVGAFDQCMKLVDDSARLRCLETAGRNLTAAVQEKSVAVVDREELRKTKRSLFGFTLPKFSLLGEDDDKEGAFQEIKSTVSSARHLGYGKWAINIAEGAVWQTDEALRDPPRSGQAIEIRKGAMGGYFVKIGNGRSARASRIN